MTKRCPSGLTRGIGVIIPANDEERLLRASLESVERAINKITRPELRVRVAVVLDSCRDRSDAIVRTWKEHIDQTMAFAVSVVETAVESVGRARALGCDLVLAAFSDIALEQIWLATSDADSCVPDNWLLAQLRAHDRGADVWAGRVSVREWPPGRAAISARWQREYDAESRPIHGANLGFEAQSYVDVGGFPPLRTSEDRELHLAFVRHGAKIHYDVSTPVVTSARSHARAPGGFADALTRLGDEDAA